MIASMDEGKRRVVQVLPGQGGRVRQAGTREQKERGPKINDHNISDWRAAALAVLSEG